MNLWSGTARADEEGLLRKVGPSDVLPFSERVAVRQSRNKRLGPDSSRTAIGRVWRSDHESDVQLIRAQLHERFSRRAFGDFKLDTRKGGSISADQLGEETVGDQTVDAHAQPAAFPQGRHACRLYGMVEVLNTSRYPFDKASSGLGEPDASCVALEQEDAKIFLQCLDARAYAGLADAERIGGTAKAEMFCDGDSLD